MKLQNLMIIFIIIIIPIVLIFSYYLELETKTIAKQTEYDEKLIEATKEAVEAFEINTVEWNNRYSTLANSKRRDILSSINVFTLSLANKLGVGGTSKENILNYVPAIVYTMYDGYYIYSPTYVPQTLTDDDGVQFFYYASAKDNGRAEITTSATQNIAGNDVAGEPIYELDKDKNGMIGIYKIDENNEKEITFTTNIDDAKKTYKHVLKTFVPYTTTYGDYTINYTLDNYIRVYEKDESREGYIMDDFSISDSPLEITVNDEGIYPEYLYENIPVRNGDNINIEGYSYIYNSNNDKRYYDLSTQKFFTINSSYEKVNLPEVDVGSSLAEYKKILVKKNEKNYIEIYQILNSNDNDTNWYYINSDGQYTEYTEYYEELQGIGKNKDCSAINYYVENYCFNNWLKDRFTNEEIQEILNSKTENIIKNINNNLNLSMSNYSANSKIDYKLPELSSEDWEQALSNISMITFFQGVKAGLKTYNNYVVVTSTENNEYVNDDSLFYETHESNYYHRYGCGKGNDELINRAFRNIEFKVQSYSCTYKNENNDENTISGHYYKHEFNEIPEIECFDCIVNRNNMSSDIDSYLPAYYHALARERYIQMSRTRLIDVENIIPEECIHTYTYISINDNIHKKQCTKCGETFEESHSISYQSYSTGGSTLKTYYHKETCNKCGYEGQEVPCPFVDTKWVYDNESHWNECTRCKQKINETWHRYDRDNKCYTCKYRKNSM